MLTIKEAMKKWFRVETKSKIIPYVVKDHAWDIDNAQNMN
jgi:hypothetical protein